MVIEKSLREYISNVSSSDPTPGGGSVCGLVGSLGGALTNMVRNLTIDKKTYKSLSQEIKDDINNNFIKIQENIEILNNIIDEDTKAFSGVIKALKLPKETDKDIKIRLKAIEEGYKGALEVPLRCAQACFDILNLQEVFAIHGNVDVITDVGIGVLLAYSGLEGSIFNIKINLLNIKDEKYKEDIEDKRQKIKDKRQKLEE